MQYYNGETFRSITKEETDAVYHFPRREWRIHHTEGAG